jgi:hypothetical protein
VFESINRFYSFNGLSIILILVFGIISIISFIFILSRHNHKTMLYSNFLMLGFASIIISTWFYIERPTHFACQARLWMQLLGYSIVIASLLCRSLQIQTYYHRLKSLPLKKNVFIIQDTFVLASGLVIVGSEAVRYLNIFSITILLVPLFPFLDSIIYLE